MGIGCGQLTAVHVGGVFRRWEYILAGPPMAQVCEERDIRDEREMSERERERERRGVGRKEE